jgi:hypothetical protein
VDLPDFSRRRGGAGRGKGRNASARGRGSRVARKPSNSSPRKRGAKARA